MRGRSVALCRTVGLCRRNRFGSTRLVSSAMAVLHQTRGISWSPSKWGKAADSRQSIPRLEDELPEIFAQEPAEVMDYVRPERSTFERLEDFWDWAVGFLQPVEKQIEVMRGLQQNGFFGIHIGDWGHVFFFYGVLMRLVTLAPSMYSHCNALRMNQIAPQLADITNKQNSCRSDRTLSSAEKRVMKEGYSRMKHALLQRHKCAQWKSFLTMFSAPLSMSAFLSIRRMTLYETDLKMAPFLWVEDLTLPDPTYALPAICATVFIANFELNQRMQRGGRSATSMYIRWGVRVATVVGVYFFAQQPSAMFAYWIGLSTAGLLQPILLRWQPFRNLFAFPDPPQAARQSIIARVKGPSLYERLFAREGKRKAQGAAPQSIKFDRIDDYNVVFEAPAAQAGQGSGSSPFHRTRF